jgi:hypothetical protein
MNKASDSAMRKATIPVSDAPVMTTKLGTLAPGVVQGYTPPTRAASAAFRTFTSTYRRGRRGASVSVKPRTCVPDAYAEW